jgi:hypothetical protein
LRGSGVGWNLPRGRHDADGCLGQLPICIVAGRYRSERGQLWFHRTFAAFQNIDIEGIAVLGSCPVQRFQSLFFGRQQDKNNAEN